MKKQLINEVKRFQKIAGLLKEDKNLSDHIVKNKRDGHFYIDTEDVETGEPVVVPGQKITFNFKGETYNGTVTDEILGRDAYYRIALDGEGDMPNLEEDDYDMGTPSGDTNAMNIAEDDFSDTSYGLDNTPLP